MKTVIVASHIFSNVDKRLSHTTTGLAIILNDIITHFSEEIEVLYYTTVERIPAVVIKRFATVESRPMYVFYHLKMRDILEGINVLLKTRSLKNVIKSLYSSASFSKFCRKIKDYKPDIVNVHDLSEQNIKIIKFCIKEQIPCLLTLHIYIGKGANGIVNEEYKNLIQWEDEVLQNYDIPINVISSGMKKRIEHDYSGRNVRVILDGTVLQSASIEHKENGEKKVLLCIGNIMKRKNQTQLLDVLKLMKDSGSGLLPMVYFIGNDPSDPGFGEEIKARGLDDCAVFVGKVEPNVMTKYYAKADAIISVSLNEAFGLTIIEAFKNGKPAIYFEDIDAAKDLYSKDAVCLINTHSNESIVEAINKCLSTEWKTENIILHSKKFAIENTTNEYEKIYRELLREYKVR